MCISLSKIVAQNTVGMGNGSAFRKSKTFQEYLKKTISNLYDNTHDAKKMYLKK